VVLAAGWAEGVEAMAKGVRCAVVPSMVLTAGSGEGARPMGVPPMWLAAGDDGASEVVSASPKPVRRSRSPSHAESLTAAVSARCG